jgi:hypothetical protein
MGSLAGFASAQTNTPPARAFGQSPQPTPTLRSGIKFKGDHYDGLMTGPKISRTGKHYVALIQSQPNASPPPKEIAAVVNGLIEAYLTHHPERYSSFVASGAKSYIGDITNPPHDFLPDGFPLELQGKVTANTPYYLKILHEPDDVVRVEWLADGQLAAISWLYLSGGKVQQVISDGDHAPPLPPSAFDPPKGSTPQPAS